ncbi:Partner and localizer of BRCA2 [Larimichthys crocea]|uniref:Partner and localizer of BRCA2 n=1 Tax=Larimichthys crocea TaxID=215358 RepID=A0A6G0J9I4_LARCR|nr:Partner and localizer of BRCA2 [Larimichthys crocea]
MVGGEQNVKGGSLLDSCTLVEGLLFPAEYYVRTTRRMTSSQSQPDMQAVILSQLNVGRQRRTRGRGRGLNRNARNHQHSDQQSQTDFSSLTSPSVGRKMESQVTDTSELNGQTTGEVSDQISACQIDTNARFTPTATTARPGRGRGRRRGRGRGRPQTPRCSLSLDTHLVGLKQTSDDHQPTISPVSSFPADGPKPCFTPGEADPVPDNPELASTLSTATQPSSGGNGAQPSSASGHQAQKAGGLSSCSSSPSPAQTPLLPLPSLSLGSLMNNLINFDIPQDFHLPDDQFASLKLHKLRQVAVESGVEHFTSPSYNTRRSVRCSVTCISGSDPVTPLSLPLSLTPTIANSPQPIEAKQAATQSVDVQNVSMEHTLKGKLVSQSLTEESCDREIPAEQQCQTNTTSTESVSVVQDCAADCLDQYKEKDNVILNTHSESSVSARNTHRSTDRSVKPQPHLSSADKVNDSDELKIKSPVISSEEQTDCRGVVHPSEDQRSINHQAQDKAVIKTLSFDCSLQKSPEELLNHSTAVLSCDDSEVVDESPVQHVNVKSPAKDSKVSSEPTTSPLRENKSQDKCLPHRRVQSQLLLSPPLASAPSSFIDPHLHPSLGATPHPGPPALPLTSSPTAPVLILPPPHSPSTQALSPPALSPCPSLPSLPPSQPLTSPAGQIQASCELSRRVGPASRPTVSSIQPQGSGGQVGLITEETAEEHMMRCTHTLKAPAGGCLVDACCLPGSSGGLCVAAAGKWAVCLWSQTSASDWNLRHTWAFNEPVINVFPVPDAAGLICVTLGQLEIREVRMLSCSSFLQVLLCEGVVQAAVGVSKSRVVTSAHSASGSTLQVFTLSDSGSTPCPQPLVSPGVCVGALTLVDGLSDALIGTDEDRCLFIWNLKTGQLLRRIILGDSLSHTACLRGYSYCGVLFVLLQHQSLTPLEGEDREATAKDQMFLEEEVERKKTVLFSLLAINPLSGKSALATQLYPPKAWSGRLCEADVNSCSVVGLSQSGCVCVWELGHRVAPRMVWAPESEGWQLARWGGGGTLVTGHHNGDVTLHCSSTSQTSLCHLFKDS